VKGQPGQEIQYRNSGDKTIGQLGQDSRDRAARAGQPEQDSRNKTDGASYKSPIAATAGYTVPMKKVM
jgi:hypothetical protein